MTIDNINTCRSHKLIDGKIRLCKTAKRKEDKKCTACSERKFIKKYQGKTVKEWAEFFGKSIGTTYSRIINKKLNEDIMMTDTIGQRKRYYQNKYNPQLVLDLKK